MHSANTELSSIIRYIRNAAELSQSEFADRVGVTRLTVTRWENGVSVPNTIAQTRLYEIAQKNGTELFDLILSDLPERGMNDGKVILYHGSKTGMIGPIGPKSREFCDFGKGFYMGTCAHQPLTMLFSSERGGTEACLYVVEFDLKGLKVMYVPNGIDWILLVAYSRGKMREFEGSALYEKYRSMLSGYDVAVGKIADDRLFTAIDSFFDGNISEKGALECMSALQLGDQYVALTEKACGQIRILERRDLSELERLCIYDVSERNRESGITTTNRIRRTYRRIGRYFDEIMKGENENPEDNRRSGRYFDEIMKGGDKNA